MKLEEMKSLKECLPDSVVLVIHKGKIYRVDSDNQVMNKVNISELEGSLKTRIIQHAVIIPCTDGYASQIETDLKSF